MAAGAGSHLRRMGHGQHLHALRQARQALADGIGDRAAHAGIDLVEHQSRGRAAIGQCHFQRQHEARQFAARCHFHQRTGAGAGIGRHPEFDAVDAIAAGLRGVGVDLRDEPRPLQFQRRQFAIDRAVEMRRLDQPGRRQGRSSGVELALSRANFQPQGFQPRLARIQRGQLPGKFLGQRRQIIDACAEFAGCAAHREQALFGALQQMRIEIRVAQGLFDDALRLVQRNQRLVQRLDAGLDQGRRLGLAALQLAQHRRQGRHRRAMAGNRLMGVVDVGCDFFGLHHGAAVCGQLRLLAGLGRQFRQFGMGMLQEIGFGAGLVHLGLLLRMGGLRRPPRLERGAHRPGQA